MIFKKAIYIVCIVFFIGCGSSEGSKGANNIIEEKVIELDTRTNVIQRFILVKPAIDIKGIVVLFKGGGGSIRLHKNKSEWLTDNFLVRTRELFANKGYVSAVVDVPTDRKNKGIKGGFRASSKHLTDIEEVIKYLKNAYKKKKIWLIGTSRGTSSVAFLSTKLKDDIDGIILTAPITVKSDTNDNLPITEMDLHKITVPVLVLSHEKDTCYVTPPENMDEIISLLSSATKKQSIIVNGGYEKNPKKCKPQTHHGFLGIENMVIDKIVSFIESN